MVNIATAYRKSDWRLPRPYALIGYAVRNIARETGINSTELSNYVWDTARENASKEQATA